ncbi:hypothetical protein ACFL20_03645 [Spirochaetota bacterium]
MEKKISSALGGPEYVPVNMMPNGLPLAGTDSSDWPDDIKSAIQ